MIPAKSRWCMSISPGPSTGRCGAPCWQSRGIVPIELVDGGCIGVFQGPRLESAAEIERARRDGCDMAGMTALPEAGLARELGLDYAGLAVVSNWGAGVSDDLLSEEDIAQTLREPMTRVRRMVAALAPRLLAREASKND